MRAILLKLLLILLIVSPLMGGGIWIYNASAAAFALQHTIRDAQNLRGSLVRILLAKESDVRGFAATRSPFFAAEYQQNSDLSAMTKSGWSASSMKLIHRMTRRLWLMKWPCITSGRKT